MLRSTPAIVNALPTAATDFGLATAISDDETACGDAGKGQATMGDHVFLLLTLDGVPLIDEGSGA